MQTNCLRNFNRRFLFVVVVVIIATIVALVFAFVSISIFVVFVSTFVSFISISIFFAFSTSFLFVVILFAFFAFLDLFSNCNIKHICKLKKIEKKLTIYNNCLILLLYICFRAKSLCCISFDSELRY